VTCDFLRVLIPMNCQFGQTQMTIIIIIMLKKGEMRIKMKVHILQREPVT
jgi:hypothetical protein